MDKVYDVLNLLKALKVYFHATHLGAADYQTHLLFERLGSQIFDEIDELSELCLGINRKDSKVLAINPSLLSQLECLDGIIEADVSDKNTQIEQGIGIEDALLKSAKEALEEKLEVGIKVYLEDLSKVHMRHKYLLQQSLMV